MGINGLTKFLKDNIDEDDIQDAISTVNAFNTLNGTIAVVDTSIYIHQYVSAVKASVDDFKTSDGRITTHIQAIISKALSLIKKKIKPIFVIDGKPSENKDMTLEKRKSNRKKASLRIKEINKKIKIITPQIEKIPLDCADVEQHLELFNELMNLREEKVKMMKRTVSVSQDQTQDIIKVLGMLGIPCVCAPEEADPQCASLVKSGIGDYVASEDLDILTFGAPVLMRSLNAKNEAMQMSLDGILKGLKITYEQFVDVCILLGCDYTPTIKGLGKKKILPLIKQYGSIDGIIENDPNFIKKYKIPPGFDHIMARNKFINPCVEQYSLFDFRWRKPKYDKLNAFLQSYDYPEEKINSITGSLSGGYYSVICGDKSINQYNKSMSDYKKNSRRQMVFEDDD